MGPVTQAGPMSFLLLFLISFSSFATTDISLHPKWLKLLHYKRGLLGGYTSQADSKSFFLHPDGRTRPELELEEAKKRFAETSTPHDSHPICLFPLRYKWLNKELGNPWKADLSGCKTYIKFFSKLAAKRASLIFSSYYLSSPNSAFGHTLLRLSRFDDKGETELLDYGINYAAQSREPNPILYIIKGIFGGFIGEFSAIPYYYKIREYTSIEFRDVWSYDLKFSQGEVFEMVDHIWELGRTHFDYFYFKENCSYHLLSILEVARPSLNLTDRYTFYTIPADTVRLLHEEGLIEEGKMRESTYSRLTRMSGKLSSADLETSRTIAEKPEILKDKISGRTDTEAARILDVSLEAFDYFNSDKILADDPKTKEKKFPILSARAMNPVITADAAPVAVRDSSPAKSHSSTRLTLAENYLHKFGKATRLEYRPALHDLLDPSKGTLQESQLEMGRFSIEMKQQEYRGERLLLDQLAVFSIRNLSEQNFWVSPISWELETGLKQMRRPVCFDCPGGYLFGSVGNSIQLADRSVLIALLLNAEVDVQSQFINNYRLGLGPKFTTRWRVTERWVAGMNSWYHFNTYEHKKVLQDFEWRSELELRYHWSERFSLSLKGAAIERPGLWLSSGEFGLQYFYE